MNLPIVIAECGFAVEFEQNMTLEQIVNDVDRQEYLNLYIKALCDATTEDGVRVSGFYTWSLLEYVSSHTSGLASSKANQDISNLEWLSGYGPRFGVTHIDRENGCKRTPKDSTKLLAAIWNHLINKQ